MRIANGQLDPRTRRLRVVANAALVLGLTPWMFRGYVHVNSNWLDAFCGFFLGISIAANLFGIRLGRGCRAARI
jgi:hypothetical protein